MIALRGKLERRSLPATTADAPASTDAASPVAALPASNVDDPASTDAAAPVVATSQLSEWVWTGEWAFGAAMDESASVARLPFSYTWMDVVIDTKDENKDKSKIAEELSNSESQSKAPSANKQEPEEVASHPSNDPSGPTAVGSAEMEEKVEESKAIKEEESKPTEERAKLDSMEVDSPMIPSIESATETETKGTDPVKEKRAPSPLPKIIEYQGMQLPASGQWKGSFDTIAGRKGHQKQTPVVEVFYLQWNLTPDDAVRTVFANEKINKADSDKLPANHIHVTGKGENQYGNFEFVGSFDMTTSVLQCQKRYVVLDEDLTPRNRSMTNDGRPYKTRKRQMSWKRRAAYDSGDDDDEEQKNKQRKRIRADSSAVSEGGAPNKGLTVVIPGDTVVSGKRLPSNSPRMQQVAAPAVPKKQAAVAAAAAAARNVVTATNPAGQMKLPAAGDSQKARWRAAHFLYYHRDDPTVVAEGNASINGGATTNGGNHTATPKCLVYEGEMLHSHRHGRGVCLYNNGMLYEGDWKRDKEHGRGTLMTADRKRAIYEGEWERGRMHGTGIYYYGDGKAQLQQNGGSRYEGEFKENLRHGSGTYVLPDGSVYSGQWREGLMCGRGIFTWPDGSVYDGEWKDGKRHGIGLLKTSDGFVYDGGWVQNSMEGRASATYPNGQQYNGLFSRGRREGRGTILFTNGAVYEGRFRDDAIDGQGTMKMSRTMVVPRSNHTAEKENDESGKSKESETPVKDDFMIPVSFQSDMGHIHRKAGFTNGGK